MSIDDLVTQNLSSELIIFSHERSDDDYLRITASPKSGTFVEDTKNILRLYEVFMRNSLYEHDYSHREILEFAGDEKKKIFFLPSQVDPKILGLTLKAVKNLSEIFVDRDKFSSLVESIENEVAFSMMQNIPINSRKIMSEVGIFATEY